MTVDKKATATFSVELASSPPAKEVTWMKDGRQLKDAPMKVRTERSGKTGLSLDVMECGPTDAGQYAVIVAGERGAEAKAAFSLNVN